MASFWFSLLLLSLGANIAQALMLTLRKIPLVDIVGGWIGDFVKSLRNRKLGLALLAMIAVLPMVGCDEMRPTRVRALRRPVAEVPAANLPRDLRQRNWPSNDAETMGQGSCVFASLINHSRWENNFELAQIIRKRFQGGEYATRLMQKLDQLGVKYKANIHGDPRFLDWCTENRRGCIFWWKPSHCCTFVGFARDPQDGREYGYILDNNYPDRYERCEREQLVRLWAGYGGFALSITSSEPASSFPWKSYEVIQ